MMLASTMMWVPTTLIKLIQQTSRREHVSKLELPAVLRLLVLEVVESVGNVGRELQQAPCRGGSFVDDSRYVSVRVGALC